MANSQEDMLISASKKGNLEEVIRLIEDGADVNAKNKI